MAIMELTADTFADKTKSGVALIDFWAPWCGPCRALTPIVEELAKDLGGKATIAKVNVDDESALAQRFSIMSIPAIFVLKDGAVVDQFVGVQTKQVLTKAIETALAKT